VADQAQESQAQKPVYDCLVLSGGGSKGAYGAGAAKAIDAYRKLKNRTNPICYIGASAGALNAYILASGNADKLIRFWLSVTNRKILGVNKPDSRLRKARLGIGSFLGIEPRSIYGNEALAALIGAQARLGLLHSPLVLAATDYTQGIPKAFYHSKLIDDFVAKDAAEPERRRRLAHFRRIHDDEMLAKALLASAAIPVFFPPVALSYPVGNETENSLYIDGGVGNNTPTREAAYFLRFLGELGQGEAGMVYCVMQDPPRIVDEKTSGLGFTDILERALGVYHYVHTRPIILGWKRINHEVRDQAAAIRDMKDWLKQLPLDDSVRNQISDRLDSAFGAPGGTTRRVDVPLLMIEPSTGLGDTLQFDPNKARREILHGYTDVLKALRDRGDQAHSVSAPALDEAEYQVLLGRDVFPKKEDGEQDG
jgi:predicted acylesterase/phospholipase RssA